MAQYSVVNNVLIIHSRFLLPSVRNSDRVLLSHNNIAHVHDWSMNDLYANLCLLPDLTIYRLDETVRLTSQGVAFDGEVISYARYARKYVAYLSPRQKEILMDAFMMTPTATMGRFLYLAGRWIPKGTPDGGYFTTQDMIDVNPFSDVLLLIRELE